VVYEPCLMTRWAQRRASPRPYYVRDELALSFQATHRQTIGLLDKGGRMQGFPPERGPFVGRDIGMAWLRSLCSEADLALGLLLSICLGAIVGFIIDHHLGHLIFRSAAGAAILLLYLAAYSVSAVCMVGLPQGLVVVAVFVWSIILSSAL
jgi:hypothetical protein